MIDIRDHGGPFGGGGGGGKVPYKSHSAIRLAYDAGVYQTDINGDIYGHTRGRYTGNRGFYHADKAGTTVKYKNESYGGQYTGYFKDYYTTVTTVTANRDTLNLYNHSDQLIESFKVVDGGIRAGVKFNNMWVVYTYVNYSCYIKTYTLDGTLISSVNIGDTNNNLAFNFFGIPYISGVIATQSGGDYALQTNCCVITKNGSIVNLGNYNLTFDATYSTSASDAVMMIQRMAFMYNE